MTRRANAYDVEVTEGAIRVRNRDRTLTIRPAPPDSESGDGVDFVVRLDDIEHWDAPDDDLPIEVVELQKILEAIETRLAQHGLSVDFE